jgi:hypothetical protein
MKGERLTRFAKVIIFVVFFAAGVAGLILGNPMQKLRASEDEACHATCANRHKFHRLVPALPPGSVAQGKYDGPWTCECY